MKIQVERKESCEAMVTVEVDSAAVESAMQKAARRLSEKQNLPGFRKGKAPYSVVLQTWGEEAVLDEALETLGPEAYRQALEQEKLEPSAVGTMKRIVSRQPLTLEFLVPVQPVVEIGDYRAVRVPFESPVIPDEDVERAMEQLRESQSLLEPVARPAQKGDVLSADAKAAILSADGKLEPLVFEGETNPQDLELDDNLGGRYPGAGPALEGISEGETRTVEVQFPDSFPIARLKGLKAQLTVKCLGVKIRKLPDWNEDLVKAVSKFATVDELRAEVRSSLEKRAVESKEEDYADSVIEKMVEGAKITFPPAMLEEEIDEEIQTLARRLEQRKTSLEVYLRTIPEGVKGLRTAARARRAPETHPPPVADRSGEEGKARTVRGSDQRTGGSVSIGVCRERRKKQEPEIHGRHAAPAGRQRRHVAPDRPKGGRDRERRGSGARGILVPKIPWREIMPAINPSSEGVPIFVPHIIETNARGERAYDIFSLLLKERIIFIGTPINDVVANLVVAELLFLNHEDSERPIHIYINSPGGQVYSGLAIYDTMQQVQMTNPIYTYAIGVTASFGTVLLAAGTKGFRYALPHATIHVHQPLGGAQGQATDVEIQAKEILRLRTLLNQILVKHTGQTLEVIERDTDRDFYLDAQAAIAYGFVDQVLGTDKPDKAAKSAK